jgi:hypothetical protein
VLVQEADTILEAAEFQLGLFLPRANKKHVTPAPSPSPSPTPTPS